MLELLFLLLPVAAAYGWYMGRRGVRQDAQKQSNHFSRQYVAGLNFLLSDEPDKAVDLFIQLLQVDSETIETHLALGNLFRSRGEVDRAIRIHQNLIARPNLLPEQRHLAMLELARDFLAAGLLDRAEHILNELKEDPDFEEEALSQLMLIYQQLRDWEQAIAVAERLRKRRGIKTMTPIGHFYCELAEQKRRRQDDKGAIADLKKALRADPGCVRANLRLAAIHIAQAQWSQAAACLEQVVEQDEDFISEVLPDLQHCYHQQGKDEQFAELLEHWVARGCGTSAVLMLADRVAEREGQISAEQLVLSQLQRHPTMKGFYRLMSYHAANAEQGRARASLEMLKALVAEQIKAKPSHRCGQCGFASHTLFWQCPSCKQWGSIKPVRGLDGE
ncbi:lipopolysaccharide assembly protein LapB [Zobellella taiwanensis]|jgi:lipopolysaccharide biosynthesis regulator YciM|uniref:Lipopolysaccharide assembly protein B n=1 Tax=Zobellella taiwanensis TaxID=347535 RepID=A0A2P7RDX0_9GAMM|nr:lipopolysaccharide assembly protein LapB [Zobellella taiwanensis]PSJ48390.1 lipopolysaccharide assembly protein LapB [Zobellella taiwanensis]